MTSKQKKIKEIENFLKEGLEFFNGNELGCFFKETDVYPLYLVMGSAGDGCACLKIAYNCDDLQDDFDIDWLMPTHCHECFPEIFDTYTTIEKNEDLSWTAKFIYDELKDLRRLSKRGELLNNKGEEL